MTIDNLTRGINRRSRPMVSFIVAVFNGATYLQRCIDSIVSQDYPNKELIVIDGGSTDDSLDILKQNTDKITYWESEPDRGIYHAWNKALEHSRGEWIAFLGSDDYLWNPGVLGMVIPYLFAAKSDGIRVVYGKVATLNEQGRIIRISGEPWEKAKKRFLSEMTIPHPGTFHHRDLFREHGNFDETYAIVGDYEFLMRELKDGHACCATDIITTGFQSGGVSNKVQSLQLAFHELSRIRKKYVSFAYTIVHPSRIYVKNLIAYCFYKLVGEGGFVRIQRIYRYIKKSQ